jgi:hypothetical protein
MTIKRFFLAVIIAGLVLLIEFKAVPWLYQKIRYGGRNLVSPHSQVEETRNKLIKDLNDYGYRLVSGPFLQQNNGLETTLKLKGENIKVIFSADKSSENQLASLQLILKEATIEESFQSGNPPQLIDLTGNKPYVSF